MPEEEQMKQVMPEHFGKNIHPGNKKILWLIVFLLLIVIGGVAGLYLINQEEALNNELTSVHLNDGPKAKRVNGVVPGNDDEDGNDSDYIRYERNGFSFEYPKGWHVYGQSFLLSDYQFAQFSPMLLFYLNDSVIFPEEVGEGGVPWKFDLALLKDSDQSIDEVLELMRTRYVDPQEKIYEVNGLTIYEFVGKEAGIAYYLEKSAEYLIVQGENRARLSLESYSEYPESDFETAKMIAESVEFGS